MINQLYANYMDDDSKSSNDSFEATVEWATLNDLEKFV